MKLKNLLWGVAALAAVGLSGCGDKGGSTLSSSTGDTGSAAGTTGTTGTGGDAGGKKDIRIAMIAKSVSNPVFLSARTGAEKAAEDLGKQNGIKITIDWRTPNDEDPQLQAQRIEQSVNDGVDAILVSCSNAEKLTSAIDGAVDKGVPVMTFDSDAPASKRFAFYGADDAAAGAQVMDELAKATGGKGNFAILAGTQTAPNLQKRVQGVKDEAAKYPDMHFVNTFYHKETPQDASAEVVRAMNANPQIDCWAMIGGWPLFATSLLKDLDPKVKIVAVDALPQELAYVDAGLAPVLLAQPTYDWGYKSVGFIVDKIVLKKDVQPINKMELVRVSKDNLNQWAKQLKDWGFDGIDAKYLK